MSQVKKKKGKEGISRRNFIKATGAIGAASLLGFPAVLRAASPAVLNITGWGGTWETIVNNHVYPPFEKEFNCKIETDKAFPFVPKLLSSSKSKPIYDILHGNSNEQWQALDAGFVEEKIDPKKVPNLQDVYPYAVSDKIVGVSIFTSGIGLGYRTDKIPNAPTSWKDLWDKKYANVRATYVIGTNSLGSCLFMMAGKLYGKGLQDTEAAFKAMEELRPIKQVDFTGTMEKLFLSGEVQIGVIHDSAVWRHLSANAPLSWVGPKEGVLALEQVYSVTKGSDKKELAYAFINHILSPKIQKLMVEELWYSPSNKKVTLAPEFSSRLFASEEKVKQLIQVDWRWFNANQDPLTIRYNKIFQAR
jgi:putative spermidine/putrescine transport system substrate-binding protein